MNDSLPTPPVLPGYTLASDGLSADRHRTLTYRSDAVFPTPLSARVCDCNTLAVVADLADGGAFDLAGRSIVVDPSPAFGALRFAVDGQPLPRVEANPPLCLSGDANGKLLPLNLSVGQHVLVVIPYLTADDARAGANPLPGTTIGFTVLPHDVPPGVVAYYVDPQAGDDANAGTDPGQPLKTFDAAYAKVRGNTGDRVQVKAGSTVGPFTWAKSGQPGAPTGVETYGGDAPATVRCTTGYGVLSRGVHDVVFRGLSAYAAGRDPGGPGFDARAANADAAPNQGFRLENVTDVTLDRCAASFFRDGIVVAGAGPGKRSARVTLTRCTGVGSWNVTTSTNGQGKWQFSGQGFYFEDVDDGLVDLCYFANNGSDPRVHGTDPTIYRHGGYGQFNCNRLVVRRTCFVNNASFGVENRSEGGRTEDCFFQDNAMGAATSGQRGDIVRCWFLNGAGHAHTGGPNRGAGIGAVHVTSAGGVVQDCGFVGPTRWPVPGLTYAVPAVNCERGEYTPAGAKVRPEVSGCVVIGWRGERCRNSDGFPADWRQTAEAALRAVTLPAPGTFSVPDEMLAKAARFELTAVDLIAWCRQKAGLG